MHHIVYSYQQRLNKKLIGVIELAKYTYLVGNEFISKYNEKFKVIEEISSRSISGKIRYEYIIKFIDTGIELKTRAENIISGKVKDISKTATFKVCDLFHKGTICLSCSGDLFIITSEPFKRFPGDSSYYACVEFLETKSEESFRTDLICLGKIKDSHKPSICDIGFMGNISIPHSDIFDRKMYQCWLNIIKRCYDINRSDYQRYGGAGVTVCTEWHCFETFYNDVQNLDGFDNDKFINSEIQLDKDKKVFHSGLREYSKENCQWLSREENYKYRRPKNYRADT